MNHLTAATEEDYKEQQQEVNDTNYALDVTGDDNNSDQEAQNASNAIGHTKANGALKYTFEITAFHPVNCDLQKYGLGTHKVATHQLQNFPGYDKTDWVKVIRRHDLDRVTGLKIGSEKPKLTCVVINPHHATNYRMAPIWVVASELKEAYERTKNIYMKQVLQWIDNIPPDPATIPKSPNVPVPARSRGRKRKEISPPSTPLPPVRSLPPPPPPVDLTPVESVKRQFKDMYPVSYWTTDPQTSTNPLVKNACFPEWLSLPIMVGNAGVDKTGFVYPRLIASPEVHHDIQVLWMRWLSLINQVGCNQTHSAEFIEIVRELSHKAKLAIPLQECGCCDFVSDARQCVLEVDNAEGVKSSEKRGWKPGDDKVCPVDTFYRYTCRKCLAMRFGYTGDSKAEAGSHARRILNESMSDYVKRHMGQRTEKVKGDGGIFRIPERPPRFDQPPGTPFTFREVDLSQEDDSDEHPNKKQTIEIN
jgi:hypothetical protein